MSRFKRGGKKSFRKKHGKKKLSLHSLSKKIKRIQREDAPTYHVLDDASNDNNYAPYNFNISVFTSQTYKYLNLPYGAVATQSASGPLQGTQEGNVVGNSFTLHSVSFSGQIYQPESLVTTPDLTNNLRMIVFWDTQACFGSAVPSWNFPTQYNNMQILGNFYGGNSTVQPASIFSHYNPIQVGPGKRFKILRDKRYTFTYQGMSVHKFNFKIRINKKIDLLLSSPTSCFPAQWLGVMFISDSSASPNPQVSMQTRMCYSE